METLELLLEKYYAGEEFTEEEIQLIKENVDLIDKKEEFAFLVCATNDIDFMKSFIRERKSDNQEIIGYICVEIGEVSFIDEIIELNILTDLFYIADAYESFGIGKYAVDLIISWDGYNIEKRNIEMLLSGLSNCTDIRFNDLTDTIFHYTKCEQDADINAIVNIFRATMNLETFKIVNGDLNIYEDFIGYIFNTFYINLVDAVSLLEQIAKFPEYREYYKIKDNNNKLNIEEVLHFFSNYIDFSSEDNQRLLYELLPYFTKYEDRNDEGYLNVLDSVFALNMYRYNEKLDILLNDYKACIYAQEQENGDIDGLFERFSKNILTILTINDLEAEKKVNLIKMLEFESEEEKIACNEERKESKYSLFVRSILGTEVMQNIDAVSLIELIASTRNVELVKQSVALFSESEELVNFLNNNLARAIMMTGDKEYILYEYEKGTIDFEIYKTQLLAYKEVGKYEICSKLDNESDNLSAFQRVALISQLSDNELIKKYVEMSDFSPKYMCDLLMGLNDNEYVRDYMTRHDDMDIHLKYILAKNVLDDKQMYEEIESHTRRIYSLADIRLDELIQDTDCKYIQIYDNDNNRDIYHINGTDEIYTREQMIEILTKAEKILEGIPYSENEDIIDQTIIFKKVYEAYIKNTNYDKAAIEEVLKDDWRRQTRCRNLLGGIVDGLAVCSGDALCLKNLLALRGISSYIIGGDRTFEAGHAWNIIKLGGDFFKFDGTAERETTLENGTLSLKSIKKAHNQSDDYKKVFKITPSQREIFDEEMRKSGRRRSNMIEEH